MSNKRPVGVSLFSFLVGLSALRHISRIDPSNELILRMFTMGVIISGVVAAIGLWRKEKWAGASFVVWAAFVLALQAASEILTVGYQWEEVVLGIVFMGTLLGVCYVFLHSQLRAAV